MDIQEVLLYYEIHKDGSIISKRFGKTLKPVIKKTGYANINISIDNKRKTWLHHRLVALALLDPVPGCDFVNHKDGDRTNNNVDNLEWCTSKQNNQRRRVHVLPEGSEIIIREMYKTGLYTQQQIATLYNSDQGYISQVINSKRR